jgi:flagellar basal-body rod protein FlgB
MNAFLFDRLHHGLGNVLDLRSAQHAITASNLANADTPGFKAKYIPFDRMLTKAVGRGEQVDMRRTHSRHVDAPGSDPGAPEVQEIDAPPWAVDGNSVTPEREVVRLNENAMMYESVSRGLSKRMAMLRYAAADGKTN